MEYIHTKTIQAPNAIIKVFSPVLSDDERERRTKAIHKAAAALIKETIKK